MNVRLGSNRSSSVRNAYFQLGRRRKKRCILSPDDPTTCVRCESKGTRCTEQLQNFPVDTRLNLKDRVAKLEAIIQSLAPGGSDVVAASGDTRSESLPNTPRSWDSKIVNEKQSFSTPSILGSVPLGPDIGQKIGPISSLFNNAIVSHWLLSFGPHKLSIQVAKQGSGQGSGD